MRVVFPYLSTAASRLPNDVEKIEDNVGSLRRRLGLMHVRRGKGFEFIQQSLPGCLLLFLGIHDRIEPDGGSMAHAATWAAYGLSTPNMFRIG